jgi:transposase
VPASREKVKLLMWDRHGFWALDKRLARGRFPEPAVLVGGDCLGMGELIAWLDGIELRRVARMAAVPAWRVV